MLSFLFMFTCTPEAPLLESYVLSAKEIDFGDVSIGTWQSYEVQILNDGTAPLELLSVNLTETSADVWSLEGELSQEVAAGEGAI
ncbi:MAG: hypothetical protein VX278_05725, partial [Myxococcota bacterium]|nr:hypothetical protein [Myxococcota bacterium]